MNRISENEKAAFVDGKPGPDRQLGPDEAHPYKRKMLGCPCPGLATMINHSYLKVDDPEQKITILQLIPALVECYNCTWPFAVFFAIAGTFLLGKLTGFNIRELGRHGKIEHDASLSRFDVAKGDALDPDQGLIDNLFDSLGAPGEAKPKAVVTLEDFAKYRLTLEDRLTTFDAQPKSIIRLIATGEVALALQAHRALTPGGSPNPTVLNANREWLRIWFSEERLAVELGWKKPSIPIGLRGNLSWMLKMKAIQDKIKKNPSS